MGWGGVLGSLFSLGSAYLQHTKFVQSTLAADQSKQYELLQTYVKGLSDAAFSGFKITVLMLANKESDSGRKGAIQALLHEADGARAGAPGRVQLGTQTNEAEGEEHAPDAEMLNEWFEIKDDDERMDLLLKHLMTLDEVKYSNFAKNLETYRTVKRQMIKNHEADELNAWGTYFEDRMAYFQARERTGAKDPNWQRTHNELKSHLQFIEWVIQASEGAWPVIAKSRR